MNLAPQSAAPVLPGLRSIGLAVVACRPRRIALGMACMLTLSACALVTASFEPPTASALPSLAGLLQRSAPAVVGIAGDLSLSLAVPGAVGMDVIGSGFRLANTRLIATAAHVVAALRGPPVVVWNARRWPARLVLADAQADLALLALDGEPPMPGLDLAAASPHALAAMPGQWVVVLGCPFGALPTATVGIVSALPGAVLWPEVLRHRIQLNAAINPGNSGGPVLNLDGQVIAVANATVPGGYGLGFAVPIEALRPLLASARPPR